MNSISKLALTFLLLLVLPAAANFFNIAEEYQTGIAIKPEDNQIKQESNPPLLNDAAPPKSNPQIQALSDEKFDDSKVSFKIANHTAAAVQVKVFHNGMHYKDLYISPYYSNDLNQVPEGKYTLEVYDIADNFMGYIEEAKVKNSFDNGSSLVSVSRFKLRPEISTKLSYPDVKDLADRVDIKKLIAKQDSAATNNSASKQSLESAASHMQASLERRIKLANITNYLLYVEIFDAIGDAVMKPQFLGADAYSPEVLKQDGVDVLVKADHLLSLKAFALKSTEEEVLSCLATNCDKILKTMKLKVSDLKIDQSDSYMLLIDQF